MPDLNGAFVDMDYYAEMSPGQRERAAAVEIAASTLPEGYRPQSVSTQREGKPGLLSAAAGSSEWRHDRLADDILDLAAWIATGRDRDNVIDAEVVDGDA